MPHVASIQIGHPTDYDPVEGDTSTKPWRTAFYKTPVAGPVVARQLGLEGDSVADTRVHGGPDKAICVYSADHFEYWREDLGLGEEFGPAAFGENFTVEGFAEPDVCIGDRWRVGEAELEVAQPREPCWKLARRWKQKDLTLRVVQTGYTGWYVRVLTEGPVEAGAAIELLDRPEPDWTLERANEVMHHLKDDREAAEALVSLESLAASWKRQLTKRLA